jgi:hypothetical protein
MVCPPKVFGVRSIFLLIKTGSYAEAMGSGQEGGCGVGFDRERRIVAGWADIKRRFGASSGPDYKTEILIFYEILRQLAYNQRNGRRRRRKRQGVGNGHWTAY